MKYRVSLNGVYQPSIYNIIKQDMDTERLQKVEKMIDFVQNDQKIAASEYKKLVKKQGHIKHKPVWVDGIKFANHNEATVYGWYELDKNFKIIKCHPMFYVTIPFTRGDQKFTPIRYTADLMIKDLRTNFLWVIEVKSEFTESKRDYRMRRKLFLLSHPGFRFKEIIFTKKQGIKEVVW